MQVNLTTATLEPVMTKSQEFEVAQAIVREFSSFVTLEALDRFALARHLMNIAENVKNILSNEALAATRNLIENHTPDDNGQLVAMNKQFTYKGNNWIYVVKEEYMQLGEQFLPDGNRDPNSVSYHSCEMAQLKLKEESKAITAQMAGLRVRILNDHPRLLPTNIFASLTLKESK